MNKIYNIILKHMLNILINLFYHHNKSNELTRSIFVLFLIMKDLKEELAIGMGINYATPMTTLGMGGVNIDGGPDMLSIDKKQCKHKMLSISKYLKNKKVKNKLLQHIK